MALWGSPQLQVGLGLVTSVDVHEALKPGCLIDPSVSILTVMGEAEVKGPGMVEPQNFWLKDP